MALRQYYRITDRRHPALMLEVGGQAPQGPLFVCIISNTAPWTYLGKRAVHANPLAGFDSGLDVFAMRKLRSLGTFLAVGQMLSGTGRPPHGKSILTFHDEAELTLRSDRPAALQVDGEYVGEREAVRFRSVPRALRVIS